jgi:hypothetical protein
LAAFIEKSADNLVTGNDFSVGMSHKVLEKDVSNSIILVNGDGYLEKLDFSIKFRAWRKFYHRHIIDIGVRVYALLSRVLTSEDKIFSIT